MKFRDRTHLLFDLDGTLIDSVPDLAKALNATLRELDLPTYDEATVRNWIGNGAATLVKRGLAGNREIDPGPDEELFAEAMERFLRHYERVLNEATGLYPGVAGTLQALNDAGYTMAVVTNKPSQFVGPILQNLSIDRHFDLIVGGEDLPRKKPDPLPLLHACEKLGCSREEALMIGDSSNDILAAQAAGIPVIAVSYGYDNGRSVRELGADEIIGEFSTLRTLLVSRSG
jgi:phosphoglycolate phosphatase